MSFFEWLGRVVMLVLAGMITLSIISALAAISSNTVPQQIGLERAEAPVPPAREQTEPAPAPEATPGDAQQTAPGNSVRQVEVAPLPPEPADPTRWLEAITYALLALAGLAALGCLLLWRMLHQQRRSAEALEAIAARPSV